MSNPQFGFDELAPAQDQPEVPLNAGSRALSRAIAGEIVIPILFDADYELLPTEWPHAIIRMTDPGPVLTAARSVIFPDIAPLTARHRFIFANETAQTLTIRGDGTGAVGVAVSAGQSALVLYDGDDIVAVAAGGGGGGPPPAPAPVVVQLACSDLTSPLEIAPLVGYFRAAHAFTLTDVRASVAVASDAGDIEIDIKVNGVSVLDGPLVIEEGEKTSRSASPQPSITTPAVADDDEITVDITDVESGSAARALIVTLKGTSS